MRRSKSSPEREQQMECLQGEVEALQGELRGLEGHLRDKDKSLADSMAKIRELEVSLCTSVIKVTSHTDAQQGVK